MEVEELATDQGGSEPENVVDWVEGRATELHIDRPSEGPVEDVDEVATVDDSTEQAAEAAEGEGEDRADADTIDSDVEGAEAQPEAQETEESGQSLIDSLSREELEKKLAEAEEFQRRHKELVSHVGRMQQQWGETRKELEQQRAQYEEQRQRAEAEKLSPYSRRHPDYDKWQRLQSRWQEDEKTLQRLRERVSDGSDGGFTTTQYNQAASAIAAKYSEDEQSLIAGYEPWLKQQQTTVLSSPDDYFLDLIERVAPDLVKRVLDSQNEFSGIQQQRDKFFEDNKDILTGDTLAEVHRLVNEEKVPAQYAAELVRARMKNESLSQAAAQTDEQRATARAQQKALGRKATVPSPGSTQAPASMEDMIKPSDFKNEKEFLDALVNERAARLSQGAK
jgi:hypothetical protein